MRLIDAQWLMAHLNDPQVLVLDARGDPHRADAHPRFDWSPSGGYREGHIPGAIPLRLRREHVYDSRPGPLEAFLDEIARQFGAVGVTGDETVVVYDEETGSWGARIGFLLELLGHADVGILDGGWTAWRAAGGPVSTEPAAPAPQPPFRRSVRFDTLATADDIRDWLVRPDLVVLDVRSESEYRGHHQSEPESRPGRVPGAVHVDWRHLSEHGRFRPAGERRAVLGAKGVTPDKEVVVYCQRAARAANVYLALQDLGYPRIRTYLGSWRDWGARDDLPAEQDPA